MGINDEIVFYPITYVGFRREMDQITERKRMTLTHERAIEILSRAYQVAFDEWHEARKLTVKALEEHARLFRASQPNKRGPHPAAIRIARELNDSPDLLALPQLITDRLDLWEQEETIRRAAKYVADPILSAAMYKCLDLYAKEVLCDIPNATRSP